MAPTILGIMLGIEARLKTIPGLRTSDYVPNEINPPVAIVGVPAIPSYHQTMKQGYFLLEPTVTVVVSGAIDRVGQHALAAYADINGEQSIREALESDQTLGGVVDSCMVIGFRPLGLETVGMVSYFGGLFTLRVVASGL